MSTLDEQISAKEAEIAKLQAEFDGVDSEGVALDDNDQLEQQEQQLRAGAEAYMAFDPDTAYSWLRDADTLKLRRENAKSVSDDKATKQAQTDTYKYLKQIAPRLGQAQDQATWDALRGDAITRYPELADLIPSTISQSAKNAVWVQAGQKESVIPTEDTADYQEEKRKMVSSLSGRQQNVQQQIGTLLQMKRDDATTFAAQGGPAQLKGLYTKQADLEKQVSDVESGKTKPYSWANQYPGSLVEGPGAQVASTGAQASPVAETPIVEDPTKTNKNVPPPEPKKDNTHKQAEPVVITDLADVQKYVDTSDRTKMQRYEDFKKSTLSKLGSIRDNVGAAKDHILGVKNKMDYLVSEAKRSGGSIKGMGADKLIYDYSKSVDPNSVVMIGEFNRIAANAGQLNNAITQFFSSLGGKLDVINPGKVKELYDIMKNGYDSEVRQYNNINASANAKLGDEFSFFPWKGGAKVTPNVNITAGWTPEAAPVLGGASGTGESASEKVKRLRAERASKGGK